MEWYYAKNGKQEGPVPHADLQGKVASGELLRTDLVWRKGMAEWLPVERVPELSGGAIPPAQEMSGGVIPPVQSGGGDGIVARPEMRQPIQRERVDQKKPLPPGHLPNYLVQSILVTVFCCLPFGIVAIVHAVKVDGFLAQGELGLASQASDQAKKWVGFSLLGWLIQIVLTIVAFLVLTSF